MVTSTSMAEMRERLVRYRDLKACTTAFIDTRTPGSERKENFTIIGPGVAENPEQHVHIHLPHGFNIGGARQPPGCVNSQHSHDTAEVFVIHTGHWRFKTGPDGADGHVELWPGDTISIPIHAFRGFENVGGDVGFMFAVLGGDDPGRVTWAPYVFDAAARYGLVLLENGRLIDTTREAIPPDAVRMRPTTDADLAQFKRYDSEAIARCTVTAAALAPAGGLSRFPDSMNAQSRAWRVRPKMYRLRRSLGRTGFKYARCGSHPVRTRPRMRGTRKRFFWSMQAGR